MSSSLASWMMKASLIKVGMAGLLTSRVKGFPASGNGEGFLFQGELWPKPVAIPSGDDDDCGGGGILSGNFLGKPILPSTEVGENILSFTKEIFAKISRS